MLRTVETGNLGSKVPLGLGAQAKIMIHSVEESVLGKSKVTQGTEDCYAVRGCLQVITGDIKQLCNANAEAIETMGSLVSMETRSGACRCRTFEHSGYASLCHEHGREIIICGSHKACSRVTQ